MFSQFEFRSLHVETFYLWRFVLIYCGRVEDSEVVFLFDLYFILLHRNLIWKLESDVGGSHVEASIYGDLYWSIAGEFVNQIQCAKC